MSVSYKISKKIVKKLLNIIAIWYLNINQKLYNEKIVMY